MKRCIRGPAVLTILFITFSLVPSIQSIKKIAKTKHSSITNSTNSTNISNPLPPRVDVIKEADLIIPGMEYTWEEFSLDYSDKHILVPELKELRKLFKTPNSTISHESYRKLLTRATDGTLLDSLDIHKDDPFPKIKVPGLSKRMRQKVQAYLQNTKSNKQKFTLKDYFEDIYLHKFFHWAAAAEERADL